MPAYACKYLFCLCAHSVLAKSQTLECNKHTLHTKERAKCDLQLEGFYTKRRADYEPTPISAISSHVQIVLYVLSYSYVFFFALL